MSIGCLLGLSGRALEGGASTYSKPGGDRLPSSAATFMPCLASTAVSEVGIQEIIANQHPLVLELLKVSNLKYFEQSQGFLKLPSALVLLAIEIPFRTLHGLTGVLSYPFWRAAEASRGVKRTAGSQELWRIMHWQADSSLTMVIQCHPWPGDEMNCHWIAWFAWLVCQVFAQARKPDDETPAA